MLIKYCRSEHFEAAVTAGSIRIGTVFEYQGIENPDLKDPEEGAAAYTLRAETDEDWILTMDESHAALRSPDQFELINDYKLKIPAGTSIKFLPRMFDTLVFSLSQSDAPMRKVMESLGYDAAYEVHNPKAFIAAVGNHLFDLVSEIGSPPVDPGTHVIEGRMDSVSYVDQKSIEVTPATRELLVPTRHLNGSDLWKKPTSFSHESEFRMAWFWLERATGDVASLRTEPLIIEVGEVPDLIRPLKVP